MDRRRDEALVSQPNPYTRFIKPKQPEPLPMRIWGYIGAGIAWTLFGRFWLSWQYLTRNRLGMRKWSLRHLDDL
jgi:hypothetical protein